MTTIIPWIPVFPLAAFAINILFGKRVGKAASWISIAASTISACLAFPVILKVVRGEILEASWTWLSSGNVSLSFGYFLNPEAAVLLFVVTVVGTLIQIYASAYMADEKRYSRFFAYVSLFMSGMLTVVIASHYVLFFMAWEIMGLCSYLLIGFYQEKPSAAAASLKAFLTTRIGDIGFFIGIMLLQTVTGNLEFSKLPSAVAVHHPLLPWAALFIFCGTIGKSAQFPLHVWLPDAMEGPTPVSALIHAATMVAAGVYLLIRSAALFTAVAAVLPIVTMIGLITALMAAIIAVPQNDIKKVLAYSTISQLGFMVAAFGLGNSHASLFHLMTHAWFKALLFLGAGSLIHGTHTQDLRKMGGLFHSMKHTSWTVLIGALAIAGVFPLSGFWSKDEILLAAFESKNWIAFWILVFTAFLTAFYMFRMIFMALFGKPRDSHIHAHESPALMTGPLWVLAAGSILLGLPGSPFMHHWLSTFLAGAHAHAEAPTIQWFVILCSVAAGLGGIAFAALLYSFRPTLPEQISSKIQWLYQLALNKFYWDEIYEALILRPFRAVGRILWKFDETIVDGAVNQSGLQTLSLSRVKAWIDTYIVDGFVNFTGYFTSFMSAVVRRAQTGFVQHYILFLIAGFVLLFFFQLK